MDALERALWGDNESDDDHARAAPTTPSPRRAPISLPDQSGTATAPPPLLVQMKVPSATQPHEPNAQSCRPLKPERVRTTLRRRKAEIERLRIAADYMEKCLTQLHEQRRTGRAAATTRARRVNAPDSASVLRPICELEQLQKSQAENEQLRGEIRDQFALSRELEDEVNQLLVALRNQFPLINPPPSPLFDGSPGEVDPGMLDGLLHTLDGMYSQTDAVFADARYATLSPFFTDVDVHRQRDPDALSVELHDSRLVPFDVKSTSKAVWQNLLGRSVRPQSGWVESLPNDTLLSHFVAYMRVPGFEGYTRAVMALRRVVEADRVVILRCSVFTHTHPHHAQPMYSRLVAWMVVDQPLHPALHAREPLSQVKHCGVTVPTLREDEDDGDVAAIAKLFAGANKRFCEDAHDEVDSYLLRMDARC